MKTMKAWAIVAKIRDEIWKPLLLEESLEIYSTREGARIAKKKTWLSRIVRVTISESKTAKRSVKR